MFQNAHLSLENKDLYLFNKTINAKTQGTLVGNWYEERELNQITGERRALPHEHFPKSHNELFRKPPNEIEFLKKRREVEKIDNTNERIMGRKINENYNSQNSEYGKNKNKADELAKVGRKYELLQRQVF